MNLKFLLAKFVDVNFSKNSLTINSDGAYVYLFIENDNRFIEF